MPKKEWVITFKNGKELQTKLCKKHEKGKRGCARLTPTKETAKKRTPKKTPKKTEKRKAEQMEKNLDDGHLTPTEETTEKETPKNTEKQKAEEMEQMFDDDDDDDDDNEGHQTISDILGKIDLAGNDEGRSILPSSSDSPYSKKV